MRTNYEKIKTLEEKLKKEEEKLRNGNEGRDDELEKIKSELGEEGGAGHVFGKKDRRDGFNEAAVRKVLRGLEAGLTQVNFKERDRIAFYFLFFVSTRFSSKPKFGSSQNLEVREGGWYLRQQTNDSHHGGDGFWKLTLQKNGKNFLIRNFYF